MRVLSGFLICAFMSSSALALTPLSEAEMGSVTAGATDNTPYYDIANIQLEDSDSVDFESLLEESFDSFSQASGLAFDFSIEGVVYADSPVTTITPDNQSLSVPGPESIELVALRNLKASANTPVIGDITLTDIRFETFNLTITPR